MNCKVCNEVFTEIDGLCAHLKIFHPHELQYPCVKADCHRKFVSVTTLKKHMLSCKITSSNNASSQNISRDSEILQNEPVKFFQMDGNPTNASNDTSFVEQNSNSSLKLNEKVQTTKEVLENKIIFFISKLYNDRTVTNSVIQNIITDFIDFVETIVTLISETIKSKLPTEYHYIIGDFDCYSILKNFESDYKRKKFLEKVNALVRPNPILLGEIDDDQKDPKTGNIIRTKKKCNTYVIPMRDVLKHFFELPNVFKEITDFINSETAKNSKKKKVYTSLFQGKIWNDITEHFKEKTVIPIFMYYDDFEINNPLMPNAGVYKIGGLYYCIASLPPQFASKLCNVFLAQFIFTEDLKEFGNEKCFRSIIDELKYLVNNGITIEVDGEIKQIFFVTIDILGDNLGLNSILGFKESFVAINYCRICRATKEEAHCLCSEQPKLLRSIENHKSDEENLTNGVKSKCCFNEVPFYHVTLNLSCDIMHDIYCGIGRYDMARIINHCIKMKYFDLKQLNERLKYFDYSDTDRGNKLSNISQNDLDAGSIVITAAQMSYLISYFTLIVGDLIPEDDDVWIFYLDLYEIVDLVNSEVISEDHVQYLRSLIKSHNQAYMFLFKENLKPKYHILTHYPTIIEAIGPLRYLSCQKFEAFHKNSKIYAHLVTSRINILITIAIKIQLQFSFRIISNDGLQNAVEFSKAIGRVNTSSVPQLKNHKLYKVVFVKVNGTTYRENNAILLSTNHSLNIPEFGIIQSILTDYVQIFFVMKKCTTNGYDDHVKGFEVILPHKNFCQVIYELNIHEYSRPMKIHKTYDRRMVIAKRDLQ